MSVGNSNGGITNLPKAFYNADTHRLIKQLLDEAKLSNSYRQKVNDALKKGSSLPVLWNRPTPTSFVEDNLFGTKKNHYFTKRTQEQIARSGAYQVERQNPFVKKADVEQEKERLRNIFIYGKGKQPEKKKVIKSAAQKPYNPDERVEELEIEIAERLEFLRTMESLGEGRKYEQIIKQEIAAKLRELDKLNKNSSQKYQRAILDHNESSEGISQILHWD